MSVLPAVAADPHPAVRSWHLLGPQSEPRDVEVIKEKKTSAVYRLVFDGARPSVIAKRRAGESGTALATEQGIYDAVLARMSAPALRCEGFIRDDGEGASWLFVEDAGTHSYDPGASDDRAALGCWLGELHTVGSGLATPLDLPDRGPGPFRAYLADGLETLRSHHANPAFDDEERAIITDLVALLELVGAHWNDVAAFCESLPRVLVHGDLIPRNICLRAVGEATHVLAIDWEKAGWGIPSIDLAQTPLPSHQFAANADIERYWEIVRDHWSGLDLAALEFSAWYATIFRCLAAIHWDARYLRLDWPHRTVAKMEYYRSALRLACRRVGIAGAAS